MIDVVLPALNESLALPPLLGNFPPNFRAIVVDNGSSDDTAAVSLRCGATVVQEPRPGYGAAVHSGLLAATSDVVCVMDADGSLNPQELPALAHHVINDTADIVVGRRRALSSHVWPWHARLANRAFAYRLNRRLGITLHDIGPVRVFRRVPMLDLGIEDRRFGYPVETLVRAARAQWRIVECDVSYGERAAGTQSKVTGSISGSVKALRDFSRVMP